MPPTIHGSTFTKHPWLRYLAWLPPLLLVILILFLNWYRVEVVWNPPYVFTALNIVFLTIIMLFVSVMAARSYLVKKSLLILFLGSGTLALGLGGLIAGIAIIGDSVNSSVIIYNTSALISGFLILTSSIFGIFTSIKVKLSGWLILIFYLVVIALISLVTFFVHSTSWPVYFVQGSGPTGTGLAVLYSTITLFAVAAFLLLIHSGRKEINFRIWYGLGLGLITVGLFGVSTQMGVGDPLNWVGRISQYLGAVYILIAVLLSIRDTGTWMLPWEQSLYEIEERYHSLYNSMSEGVALHRLLYDEVGEAVDYIITDINPAYEEILGYKREDVVGQKGSEVYGADNPPYLDIYSSVAETGDLKTFETYFQPMNRHFNISVFSPKKGEFATAFEDITQRIQADQAQHTTFKRFYSILSSMYGAILLVADNDRVEFANQSFGDMFNLDESPEELVGLKSSEIIDKIKRVYLDPYQAVIRINEIVEQGQPVKGEEIPLQDNRTCMRDFIPIYISDKSFGRLWHYTDITNRIMAEEKLKESEARFRSVFQNSLDVIYRFNLQTDSYEYMSPAIRNLGFQPQEMMDMTNEEVLSRVHPKDLPDLLSVLSQINRTGSGMAEYRFLGNDDTYRWWSNQMVVTNDGEGQPLYRDGSVRDITMKKQMEREILRKQTEIQTLFDNTPAGMVLFNGKHPYTVLVHNRAYQEFFDEPFRSQGMVGLNLYQYAPEVEAAGVVAVFNEVVRSKKPKNFLDFPYNSNPSYESWFNWYMAPIIVDDEVEALVSMSIDVTPQHRVEEALKTRSEELAKSNADLKQFAYVASHDLKEPLRMITSFLQLLDRRYKDQLDEDAHEFIDFAVDGAKRLDNMIMDLLEYSKVTNKELEFTEVNTQEVLDNVLQNLSVLIDENEAHITHDSLPLIRGDKTHIIRLLQNLLENGIKYRREETPHIHISALKEEDQYIFSIKDNGMGIDPEHLERIFTMFQRLHNHTYYEGTGIGLAISQRIVHQHDGEIWAESEPGKGSTFYFTIPVTPD
ncbi:MAG: ATP-binding protein [Methanobacteriaceae archaeon]